MYIHLFIYRVKEEVFFFCSLCTRFGLRRHIVRMYVTSNYVKDIAGVVQYAIFGGRPWGDFDAIKTGNRNNERETSPGTGKDHFDGKPENVNDYGSSARGVSWNSIIIASGGILFGSGKRIKAAHIVIIKD